MPYKIEVVYTSGWDDAGWTEESFGATRPLRFKTLGDAQAALDEFFTNVNGAVLDANMDAEENRELYRIVAVK